MTTQKTRATANMIIVDGKNVIALAGQEIAITFSKDGKSVYIPNGNGGYVAKPACFVTVAK